MTRYIGILDGKDDVWGIWFPDIKGCAGGGPTPDAAVADATSALATVARMMVDDGVTLPPARSIDEVSSDPWVVEALATGSAMIAIPLFLEDGHTRRANISVDAGTLALIDAAAKSRGVTRSAFLVAAAKEKIRSEV